jgi:hypothetical protein
MSVQAKTIEVISSKGGSSTSESDTEIESEISYADFDSYEEKKILQKVVGM